MEQFLTALETLCQRDYLSDGGRAEYLISSSSNSRVRIALQRYRARGLMPRPTLPGVVTILRPFPVRIRASKSWQSFIEATMSFALNKFRFKTLPIREHLNRDAPSTEVP